MPNIQTWPASAAVYDDDNLKAADCRIDTSQARSLAEMLLQVSRIEKLKSTAVKLLGDWRPREVVRAAREKAICGGTAHIVCIDKAAVSLVLLRADDEESVYKLANFKARHFVLGVMVFFPNGGIATYPEQDEIELKSLLLNFFATITQNVRALDETDKLIALSRDENFIPENHEKTLDAYSALTDQQLATDIHDEITYVNRTTGE